MITDNHRLYRSICAVTLFLRSITFSRTSHPVNAIRYPTGGVSPTQSFLMQIEHSTEVVRTTDEPGRHSSRAANRCQTPSVCFCLASIHRVFCLGGHLPCLGVQSPNPRCSNRWPSDAQLRLRFASVPGVSRTVDCLDHARCRCLVPVSPATLACGIAPCPCRFHLSILLGDVLMVHA